MTTCAKHLSACYYGTVDLTPTTTPTISPPSVPTTPTTPTTPTNTNTAATGIVHEPLNNNSSPQRTTVHPSIPPLRRDDDEHLAIQLSHVQKQLDDAIRLVFPPPRNKKKKKKRGRKRARTEVGAMVTTTRTIGESTIGGGGGDGNDGGGDGTRLEDLEREIETCLREHREIVTRRHALAFLPARYVESCVDGDV